jgi:hypothetical protein
MTTTEFTTQAQYLELIFPQNVHVADLDMIKQPSGERAGLAILKQARLEHTATPGAWRLISANGGLLLGIVFDAGHVAELLDGPADNCYWLIDQDPDHG